MTEYEVASFAVWEQSFREMLASPDTAQSFARMVEVTESGRREFYNIVD